MPTINFSIDETTSANAQAAAQIRSLASAYLLPTGLLNRASRIVD